MKDLTSGERPQPYVDHSTEKIADPSNPNRMVSNKKANRPFLAYKEYRQHQEALHAGWLEKKKAFDEAIARGEKVEPLEPDPTAPEEVGILGLLKFIVIVLFCIAFAGKFITGSYSWESDNKWLQTKTYFTEQQLLFSEQYLTNFDGQNGKPAYLAIDGEVYDVSKGKAYQPGGSYHHFIGIDAARAFGTGCFKAHRTHDLRGLSEAELAGVQHWKQFYANHKDYVRVGKVIHPPIDPDSPIPEHCISPKAQKPESTHKQL